MLLFLQRINMRNQREDTSLYHILSIPFAKKRSVLFYRLSSVLSPYGARTGTYTIKPLPDSRNSANSQGVLGNELAHRLNLP